MQKGSESRVRWGAIASKGAGGIRRACRRRGAAALDYVLILGVVLPMVAFIMWIGPWLIALVYEMVAGLIAWPFM